MKKSFRDTRFMKMFYKAEEFVIETSLGVIMFFTLYNFFARYVLRKGVIWVDELVSFLLVLMAMLGMAVGVKEKSHSALESFVCRMKPGAQTVIYILDALIVTVFLAVATYGGFRFVASVEGQRMIILKWPVSIMYGFVVVGCLFSLFENIINTIEAIRNRECRFIPIEEQMCHETGFDQSI